jgi:hypothetical protein
VFFVAALVADSIEIAAKKDIVAKEGSRAFVTSKKTKALIPGISSLKSTGGWHRHAAAYF